MTIHTIRTALRLSGVAFRRQQMHQARDIAERPRNARSSYMATTVYNGVVDGHTTRAVASYHVSVLGFRQAKDAARGLLAKSAAEGE